MKMARNKGFGPLAVILVIAVVAAVGGGVYYSKKEDKARVEVESEMNGEVNVASKNKGGTLRALLSLNKDMVCTFSASNATGGTSGTVYISGTMMRGDYVTTGAASGNVESHMVRNGDKFQVWSGAQGAVMTMSEFDKAGNTNAKGSVGLDQEFDYECKDWSKDSSKFTVPGSVTFVDMNAMMKGMQGQMDAALKANANLKIGN